MLKIFVWSSLKPIWDAIKQKQLFLHNFYASHFIHVVFPTILKSKLNLKLKFYDYVLPYTILLSFDSVKKKGSNKNLLVNWFPQHTSYKSKKMERLFIHIFIVFRSIQWLESFLKWQQPNWNASGKKARKCYEKMVSESIRFFHAAVISFYHQISSQNWIASPNKIKPLKLLVIEEAEA